jgi:choline dehydrogenase
VAAQASGEDFDYIVVGSGAGGGPLAANLARAGMSVLLLEAGGEDEDYCYQVPAFHALASEDPDMSWQYFVRHYASDAEQRLDPKFTPERNGVFYPRSGTLGGCTAHNAMITIYPHPHDWDEIAEATGDPSWHSGRMWRYFQRLERCTYARSRWAYPRVPLLAALVRALPILSGFFGNPGRHGFNGWLSTSEAPPTLALGDLQLWEILVRAIKTALAERVGRPETAWEGPTSYLDPNDWRWVQAGEEGLFFTPLATENGRRNGTREYVRAIAARHPDKLTVKLHALVTRVLFDDRNRAIGVEYLDEEHAYRADPHAATPPAIDTTVSVRARREVILCAGAFNTPQVLMLSGIGPRDELSRLGIPVRVDLPGVGRNLQDRYEVGVVSEMESDFALLQGCTFQPPAPGGPIDPAFTQWQKGEGVYTTNGATVALVVKSTPDKPDPDLFLFGLPANFQGYYPGYAAAIERNRNYFTWAILKAHTRNTAGTVTLRSTDPRDVPAINFHYFGEGNDAAGEDLDAVVTGVELARRIMADADGLVVREVAPGSDIAGREAIEDYVKTHAWGHHASCTCKMGPASDPMAVVDSQFNVHGTSGLRVVDASVFPRIPGFFIVTAIYVISEKASDVILAAAQTGHMREAADHLGAALRLTTHRFLNAARHAR